MPKGSRAWPPAVRWAKATHSRPSPEHPRTKPLWKRQRVTSPLGELSQLVSFLHMVALDGATAVMMADSGGVPRKPISPHDVRDLAESRRMAGHGFGWMETLGQRQTSHLAEAIRSFRPTAKLRRRSRSQEARQRASSRSCFPRTYRRLQLGQTRCSPSSTSLRAQTHA